MDYDTSMLEDTETESPPQMSPLQLHARMFTLGDRYDISGLRSVAAKKYSSRCDVSEPLEFIDSIYDVYEGTPASIGQLRALACIRMRSRLPKILDEEVVRTAYQRVLTDVPEFSRDLLDSYVKAPLFRRCSTCYSDQAFEALQARCKRCGKGSSCW